LGPSDPLGSTRGFFSELMTGSLGVRVLKISILVLLVLISVIFLVVDDK
jgi:hypothetical protein